MYTVLVDENSHYREEAERYEHGMFATYDEAIAACQRIVDDFLAAQYRPGLAADELYRLYTLFGEDPFISPERPGTRFSAREVRPPAMHAPRHHLTHDFSGDFTSALPRLVVKRRQSTAIAGPDRLHSLRALGFRT